MIRAAVLTVSDKGSRGERVDTAGPTVAELLKSIGAEVIETGIIADERWAISGRLRRYADELHADLVLTTGGTGLSPRDVTPEATLDIAERLVPGIAELMRSKGLESTRLSSLSRSVAVTRGRTLIVNLPGSERGARESLQAILDLIPHAVELLRGDDVEQHPVEQPKA
jgi:molybdenum cofactor synthesis domain-containing protein